MKYMILLYGSQRDYDVLGGKPGEATPMSAEEVAALHARMEAVHQGLEQSGELVDAQGLTAPVHGRRVQLRAGVPVVTDGPYAETEEVLAGYTVVDCASVDRATEIAASLVDPGADGDHVDVRPILGGVEELEL